MMAMRNAIFGGRSTHSSLDAAGAGTLGSRRTRRAERQALVSSLAVVSAFLFVSAVVFGLI